MIYIIPLLCFVIALIMGALLLRAGRGVLVAVLVVMLAVVMAWAI